MSDERSALERQIEADLRELGPQLSVDWPAEVRSAVRAAMDLELTESWWQTTATTPAASVLDRVRAAIRRELHLGQPAGARILSRTHPPRESLPASRVPERILAPAGQTDWRRKAIWGSLAAAAAIALVVGLIPRHNPEPVERIAKVVPDAGSIDRFTLAAETVWAAQGIMGSLPMDLEASQDTLSEWQNRGGRLEQMIDDMHQQLDDLFVAPTEDDQLGNAFEEMAPA